MKFVRLNYITGVGEHLYVPGSGLTTVGSATLHGISVVLRGELMAKAFRLNEVRIRSEHIAAVSVSHQRLPVSSIICTHG